MTIERLHVGPRMSQVVIHNKIVYLAGQVAGKARGKNVTEQTQEILATLDALLKEAETDKSRVLSATIWLSWRSRSSAGWADFCSLIKVPVPWCVSSWPLRSSSL